MLYPFNRILSYKQKENTNTYNHLDKSQNHAERRKPITKEYILYDIIYMELWERQMDLVVTENRSVVVWVRVGGRNVLTRYDQDWAQHYFLV